MFSALLNQLVNSIKIVGRTVRAFLMRYFTAAWSRVRRLTSFSRQVARLAPKAMQSAALAGKKPTRREDYVETGQLFVSKSFLLLVVLGLVILGLAIYFLVWPFLLSRFFTARMVYTDSRIPDYTGKVIVYYDEEKNIPMYSGKLEEGLLQGKGCEFDPDGVLSYEGTFADGIREGEGKAFQSGVLTYEGEFSAGVYEGQGTLYDEDGMAYEGGFSEGKYSGTGKLYETGALFYSGEFEKGCFQGQGTEYWPDGTVHYVGGFADGAYDQEGKLYSEDGILLYSGDFSAGQYQGEGTQYDPETGRKYYVGSFEAGVFQGSGTIYPDDSQSIEAEFEAGEVQGPIQWYKNGLLYYSGEAEDLSPEGHGSLYTTGGETVFQGTFVGGTVDGGTLLGMDLEQLTKSLGDCTLTTLTDAQKNGFTLRAEEFGFTAFLSYQQNTQKPTVYYVYLYPTDWFDVLPWDTQEDYETWLETAGRGDYTCQRLEVLPDFAGAVPFDEQSYERVVYTFSDHVFSLWFDAQGECFMIEWYSLDALPETAELNPVSDDSDSRTTALMDKLGLLEAEQTEETDGETQNTNENYGTADLGPLLETIEEPETFSQVYSSLLQYYKNAETLTALDETLALNQEMLQEAATQQTLGQGDESRTKSLNQQIEDLEKQEEKCRLEMEMETLEVKNATGHEISDYDLRQLILVVDPMELDVDRLWQDALDYAQAQADAQAEALALAEAQAQAEAEAQAQAIQTQVLEAVTQAAPDADQGEEESLSADLPMTLEEAAKLVQAQQTAEQDRANAEQDAADLEQNTTDLEQSAAQEEASEEITGEVDEEALLLELKLKVLNLEMAYSSMQQALGTYETAQETVSTMEKSYSLGIVTRQEVYEAMAEKNTCRTELYSALTAYNEELMELNLLCGGSLSRDYDWLNGAPAIAA